MQTGFEIPDELPENPRHYMAELNDTGDTKYTWDADNEDEVALARDQFNLFKKKGFAAFRTDKKGMKLPEQMHEFDPHAERIIFVKQMVGG